MANLKISELTAAAALTGVELVEAVQGGLNVKTTTQAIADLGGGGGAVTSVNGATGVVVLDAGDIGSTPVGSIAATDVQAAITELDSDIQGHITDATAAHAGTAISNTPAGNIAATTVQAAINELDAEKTNILLTYRRLTSNHTLDATDLASVNGGQRLVIEMNVGSANTVTVPLNSTQAFPIGSQIQISQYGGGETALVATGGVTLRASSGLLTLGGQYTFAFLEKVDTNEWYLRNGEPTVLSGTWTPTLTNTTNIAASTAYLCSYSRVGNRVTFSGRVDIDPTSTGNTVMGISLPVTSGFTTANQAGGVAFSPGIAGQGAAILSDATNDRLTLQYIAVDTTNQAFYFTGGFEVI